MLTIHTTAGSSGPAVAVEGDRIAAVGPFAELSAAHPGARVREWPAGAELRAGRLWEGPLPQEPSPRERVYAAMRLGATAVLAAELDAGLHEAARRGGMAVLEGPRDPVLAAGERADLAVFDAEGACLATVVAGRLVHRRR